MDSSGLPIPIGGSEPLSAVLLELSSRGLRLASAPSPSQTRDTSFASPGVGRPSDAPGSSNLNGGFLETGNPIPNFSGSEFQPSQGNNRRPESDQLPIVDANSDHTPSFGMVNAGLSALIQKIHIHDSSGNKSLTDQQQPQAQQLQAGVLNGDQAGPSWASNVQQLQNQSTNFDLQKTIYQNDCQLLLNSVKSSLDQRTTKNQNDPQQLSYFMRNPSTTTQIQIAENQGSLGARPQHSGQPGFFQHQQQGQHHKQRVSPISPLSPMAARAHMNLLHKMEKIMPNPEKQPLVEEQPLPGKQPLVEKQVEGEVLPEKSGVNSAYIPGRGAERLNQYLFQQRNRPKDNNIQFWRNLVAEFFAPGATKRWCVSLYKNIKQIDNLFKVAWQCDMCNVKPCCGFEISEELLPRLHKMKYDIGVLEEHLHIDTPNEYQGACGQIFLHYPKAAEESEYEQVRIVRHGQLRLVFSPDLKIRSWEFCAQHHKEYIHRNSIIPQVCQLGAAMQNYQLSTQDSSSVTPEEFKKRSDMHKIAFVTTSRLMGLKSCIWLDY
ncbi:hypothetical protein Pfo_008198 [Paulownia fortunei]|nr:hypothetical protein Pfo_008198 [Paulownia fortunei]